jgi:farnesyl-diphosphate farnesyltransferase
MAQSLSSPLIELLKQTSRSFHLTLRVLPRGVRPQIGLAYLLARTTDTIADTEIIAVEDRLRALQQLRGRILGIETRPLDFVELVRRQESPAERALLENSEASLKALGELPPADAHLVRKVLDTITSGQELDLHRFHGASTERIASLQNEAELDDYTYRVAGCVGEFWTDICIEHLFNLAELYESTRSTSFKELGIRFGKGLQLVNILRDLPVDLRKGRCYLPLDQLTEAGLKPANLLQPESEAIFRPQYHRFLDLAESQLEAGWIYTNCIPWRQMRIRLACAWPILIGMETIKRLRVENVLDPQRRVKISRAEVRRLVWHSILCYPRPSAWKRLVKVTISTAGKPVASGANFA